MSSSTSSATDGWKVLNPTVAAAKAEVAHSQSDNRTAAAAAAQRSDSGDGDGRRRRPAPLAFRAVALTPRFGCGPPCMCACSECAIAVRVAAIVAAGIDAAASALPVADRSSGLCSGIAISSDAHSSGVGDGPAHGCALCRGSAFGAQDIGAVAGAQTGRPSPAVRRQRRQSHSGAHEPAALHGRHGSRGARSVADSVTRNGSTAEQPAGNHRAAGGPLCRSARSAAAGQGLCGKSCGQILNAQGYSEGRHSQGHHRRFFFCSSSGACGCGCSGIDCCSVRRRRSAVCAPR